MDKKYGKIKISTGEITNNGEILKLQKGNQEIKTGNEVIDFLHVLLYKKYKNNRMYLLC